MSGVELIFISQRVSTKADVGNVKNCKRQESFFFFDGAICI